MIDTEIAIVGGGAVGLACAALISESGREVVLIERNEGLARETSARNSGVVHAGIYYAPGSLKATSCVEGRALLYARCARDGIAHRKTGKIIVATEASELAALEALRARGIASGAGDLELLSGAEVTKREPRVRALAGLWSPESGIVDAHGLSASYAAQARAHGATIVPRTSLVGADRRGDAWSLETIGPDGPFTISARTVINAAGLACDRVAAMFGLDVDALGWRLRFCKGDYFAIAPRVGKLTEHLVYPAPAHAGLGVHVTTDLGGAFHAGPDATYVEAPSYAVDAGKAGAFAAALARYLPGIDPSDLSPGFAGVRPKLYGEGEPVRDFVLEETPGGVIHLIGIESPGLTASEALARRVLALLSR